MSEFAVTTEMVRAHATPETLQRGREYYNQGAVTALIRRGNRVEAEVEGSDIEPYEVSITLPPKQESDATCTCPYDWGGWCKHIVAAMLACINEPETVEERASLDTLLADLNLEQLQTVVRKLVAEESQLVAALETQVELVKARAVPSSTAPSPSTPTASSPAASTPTASSPTASIPSPPPKPIDPRPFRQSVRSAIRSVTRGGYADSYYGTSSVVGELDRLVNEAIERVEAGDGRGALTILEAVTDEIVPGFEELDDSDGELADFYTEMGTVWTEAILTADLDRKERKAWAKKLDKWQGEISDYGVDTAFTAAIEAAEKGWEDPDLVRTLRGERTEIGTKSVRQDVYGVSRTLADPLTTARLNVLERQGRVQEALHLARAEGELDRYTTLLVQLDRQTEATEFGLKHFTTAAEALTLARALQERQATAEALCVGAHGLQLEGNKTELARWLRDLALTQGRTDLAIDAALEVLQSSPTLEEYRQLQEIAGERWPELKETLLAAYERYSSYVPDGVIEIYLHEQLIDRALKAVQNGYSRDMLARVADAAIETHPQEVIAIARKQAEDIMDRGKSEHYDSAARWLGRARAAYLAAGQADAWQAYYNELLGLHQRKYKLVPLLQALNGDRVSRRR